MPSMLPSYGGVLTIRGSYFGALQADKGSSVTLFKAGQPSACVLQAWNNTIVLCSSGLSGSWNAINAPMVVQAGNQTNTESTVAVAHFGFCSCNQSAGGGECMGPAATELCALE